MIYFVKALGTLMILMLAFITLTIAPNWETGLLRMCMAAIAITATWAAKW